MGGFNFRSTPTYVSDNAGETYVVPTDSYPTTRGGETFGYLDVGMDARDRSTSVDVRLAGVNFVFGTTVRLQIDLPASGSYDIDVGETDVGSVYTNGAVTFKDNTTTLFTLGPDNVSASDVYDANDSHFGSSAAWASGKATRNVSFSSSTFIVSFNGAGGSGLSGIAHVKYTSTGGSGPTLPPMRTLLGVGR